MYRDYDFDALGKRLRENRKTRQLSQEEVADKCGVSKSVIGRMERGERITLDKLMYVAYCYDLSVEELITGNIDYFNNELYDALGKCSYEKQKLIYSITKLLLDAKFV